MMRTTTRAQLQTTVRAALLAALVSQLSGCSTVRSVLVLDGASRSLAPPIHNPFESYANGRKDPSRNLVLRSKKGERAMEIELPPESQTMSELTIPVGAALTASSSASARAPASDAKSDSKIDSADEAYVSGIQKVNQLFKSARYELAILEADRLIRDYPTDPKLHVMRGTLLDRVGQRALALKSWRQALEYDPGNADLKRYVERRQHGRGVASP